MPSNFLGADGSKAKKFNRVADVQCPPKAEQKPDSSTTAGYINLHIPSVLTPHVIQSMCNLPQRTILHSFH